jgi:hypothetical protein
MKITLPTEKKIVVREAETKKITDITVLAITDSPSQKKVSCVTKELGAIVLWSDADYDTIGQWTDSDVEARIKKIYK